MCRVERKPCLMEVVEGEAGRASALDASSPVTLWVIAGMPIALGLDPLGDSEFVAELKHRLPHL
jgi:hypothetical protein